MPLCLEDVFRIICAGLVGVNDLAMLLLLVLLIRGTDGDDGSRGSRVVDPSPSNGTFSFVFEFVVYDANLCNKNKRISYYS